MEIGSKMEIMEVQIGDLLQENSDTAFLFSCFTPSIHVAGTLYPGTED